MLQSSKLACSVLSCSASHYFVIIVECHCSAGLLVELDALGNVLEAQDEWHADAVVIQACMLRILSLVASRYLSSGKY